jgi:hypothetical protein
MARGDGPGQPGVQGARHTFRIWCGVGGLETDSHELRISPLVRSSAEGHDDGFATVVSVAYRTGLIQYKA